jgi:hypothetical protein
MKHSLLSLVPLHMCWIWRCREDRLFRRAYVFFLPVVVMLHLFKHSRLIGLLCAWRQLWSLGLNVCMRHYLWSAAPLCYIIPCLGIPHTTFRRHHFYKFTQSQQRIPSIEKESTNLISSSIMSLPVSYFPSVRPSAVVLGTVFEHVSSFIVYGPLFGQTWQKAMNADKVQSQQITLTNWIRTRNSGRVRKPRMLLPSMDPPSSLLVSRYVLRHRLFSNI